jgi:glycerol-3-phosphate acyltransferase PlsY
VDDLPLTIGLIVMGYLAGSLPMGVIVARLTRGTDPRTVGSGRTGGTNALRAMGWPRAILVGLLDLAKGAVPILVARAAGAPVEVQALTGVAAVLGSWKSVFLRFHGGRGVATGVGGMLAVSPIVCLLAAPAFFVIIGVTRYVSLGSLLGTAFGAGLAIVFVLAGWLDPGWLLYVVPGLAIVWVAHRDNIERLVAGTERRFDPSDRQPVPPPGSGEAT